MAIICYICGMTDGDGYIKIHVERHMKDGMELSPSDVDISELSRLLESMEVIFGKDRSRVSYSVENGSVWHNFLMPLQQAVAVSAILQMPAANNSLSGMEPKTAASIQTIQVEARERGLDYTFVGPGSDSAILKIGPDTAYFVPKPVMVEAEVYLYGILTTAGGKDSVSVSIDTEEYGVVHVETEKGFLSSADGIRLYKRHCIRASCLQDARTGAIDTRTLRMIEMKGYEPKFDPERIRRVVERVGDSWKGVDVDGWVAELRGC